MNRQGGQRSVRILLELPPLVLKEIKPWVCDRHSWTSCTTSWERFLLNAPMCGRFAEFLPMLTAPKLRHHVFHGPRTPTPRSCGSRAVQREKQAQPAEIHGGIILQELLRTKLREYNRLCSDGNVKKPPLSLLKDPQNANKRAKIQGNLCARYQRKSPKP